jgi:iron complex transport system permease protein
MTVLAQAPAASAAATAVRPRGGVVRIGPAAVVVRPRALAVALLLAVLAAGAFVVDVAVGDFPLPVRDVLAVLAGGGDDASRFVVVDLRLPRALTAVLVGAALGMSGAVMQAMTRNPLASPDILGITTGAGFAVVALLVLGTGTVSTAAGTFGLSGAALAGGLGTALLVHVLAWRQGLDGNRVVLVGIGLSSAFGALTIWLLVRAEVFEAQQATVWLTGSLNGRGWDDVRRIAVALALAGAVLVVAGPALAALRFGPATATALGVRVGTARVVLLGAAVVLASFATASAGPIAFVALVAPQVVVRLVATSGPPVVLSGLAGAALLAGADVVSRALVPVELPVGVVTAALGAPFLLYLLVVSSRRVTA